MNRRDFLRANSSICAGWALSRAVPVLADTPSAGEWRTFEIVTKVELLKPEGVSHIWLPAPLIRNTPYQNTISTRFKAEGGTARLSKDKQSAFGIVSAMYAANAKSLGGGHPARWPTPEPDRPHRAEKLRRRFVFRGNGAIRFTD